MNQIVVVVVPLLGALLPPLARYAINPSFHPHQPLTSSGGERQVGCEGYLLHSNALTRLIGILANVRKV